MYQSDNHRIKHDLGAPSRDSISGRYTHAPVQPSGFNPPQSQNSRQNAPLHMYPPQPCIVSTPGYHGQTKRMPEYNPAQDFAPPPGLSPPRSYLLPDTFTYEDYLNGLYPDGESKASSLQPAREIHQPGPSSRRGFLDALTAPKAVPPGSFHRLPPGVYCYGDPSNSNTSAWRTDGHRTLPLSYEELKRSENVTNLKDFEKMGLKVVYITPGLPKASRIDDPTNVNKGKKKVEEVALATDDEENTKKRLAEDLERTRKEILLLREENRRLEKLLSEVEKKDDTMSQKRSRSVEVQGIKKAIDNAGEMGAVLVENGQDKHPAHSTNWRSGVPVAPTNEKSKSKTGAIVSLALERKFERVDEARFEIDLLAAAGISQVLPAPIDATSKQSMHRQQEGDEATETAAKTDKRMTADDLQVEILGHHLDDVVCDFERCMLSLAEFFSKYPTPHDRQFVRFPRDDFKKMKELVHMMQDADSQIQRLGKVLRVDFRNITGKYTNLPWVKQHVGEDFSRILNNIPDGTALVPSPPAKPSLNESSTAVPENVTSASSRNAAADKAEATSASHKDTVSSLDAAQVCIQEPNKAPKKAVRAENIHALKERKTLTRGHEITSQDCAELKASVEENIDGKGPKFQEVDLLDFRSTRCQHQEAIESLEQSLRPKAQTDSTCTPKTPETVNKSPEENENTCKGLTGGTSTDSEEASAVIEKIVKSEVSESEGDLHATYELISKEEAEDEADVASDWSEL